MKFDYCIGNPPYQSNTLGNNDKFAPSVFNDFMDVAYNIADKVELITPAKFLFNAGNTPKKWNDKLLHDPHFKVEHYYKNSKDIFPYVNISGGVAIHYHDMTQNFEEINVFIEDERLATIQDKVYNINNFVPFSDIVVTRTAYRLTDKLHEDFPNAINDLSNGHKYDMSTNVFDRIPYVFCNLDKVKNIDSFYKILGRTNNERTYKYIKRIYVKETLNTNFYKVVIPKAWDCIMKPTIEGPYVATTETFITVGKFIKKENAIFCLKYIQTKFARCLLMILKTTQDLSPEKWKYVPLQDFTSDSDIDWSQSIADIDKQLYKKYNLSKEEIDFIETHVKEMN